MTGRSSKESALSSLERSRNATELLVKKQNVRYPSSRETTELEHLGPGAEPEALAGGLAYDEQRRIKPDIVYVSMSGYGHTGRHHQYTTCGPVAQAVSGLPLLSGLPDKPPAGWGWSYMDDTGGMYGAMCALTGLYHRNMTGQGQHIDLSQMVASVPLNGPGLLDFTVNGRGSRRPGYPPGNRAHWPGTPLVNNYRGPTVAPHNAYRPHPGGYNAWCVIVCHSDEEWQRLVQVMGAPSWTAAPKFATLAGRLQHQQELDKQIEKWSMTLEKSGLTG